MTGQHRPSTCALCGARHRVVRRLPAVVLGMASALATTGAAAAPSTDTQVLATTALRPVLEALAPAFEQATGSRLRFVWEPSQGPAADSVLARLRRGTHADAVAITGYAMDTATAEGLLDPAQRVDVASSRIGVASRPGHPPPVIDTMAAFRAAVQRADRIAISTGVSGQRITELLVTQGMWPSVQHNIVHVQAPRLVGHALLAGEASIGFQQMSELLTVPAVPIGGPLPDSVMAPSVVSMSVPAAHRPRASGMDLIRFVCHPRSHATLRKWGYEPLPVCR